MRPVLFFSGYMMTVFHWKGARQLCQFAFPPTPEGIIAFRDYLERLGRQPVRLLVDLIEEEFQQREQPHLRGRDYRRYCRNNGLRMFDQSPFLHHSLLEVRRSDSGKRDFVLYSGLTNPELMAPWLLAIRETATPLLGIWSVPQLSRGLIEQLKLKRENVLLLSQEAPSTLRQSFFRNGKLYFSRQAAVPRGGKIEIRRFLQQELQHTRAFLASRHFIKNGEPLRPVALLRDEWARLLREEIQASDLHDPVIASVSEVYELFGINTDESVLCNVLFTWLCSRAPQRSQPYLDPPGLQDYYGYQAGQMLKAAAMGLFCIALGFSQYQVVEALIDHAKIPQLLHSTQQADSHFKKQYGGIEEQLGQAARMRHSVEWFDSFRQHSYPTLPGQALAAVSRVLERPDLEEIQITSLRWLLGDEVPQATGSDNSLGGDDMDNRQQPGGMLGMIDEMGMDDMADESMAQEVSGRLVHNLLMRGIIKSEAENYRRQLDLIELLRNRLSHQAHVEDIAVRQLPVDISSSGQVSGRAGVKAVGNNDQDKDREFEILISFSQQVES